MLGGLTQRGEISALGRESPPPRDEFDTPVPFLAFTFACQQHSRLSRACQMSAAARLAVKTVDVDDAQSAFAVDFFTNALRGEFVGGSVAHCDGTVVEDNFIHATFSFLDLVCSDGRRSKVDGGNFTTEMKRYSLKFEQLDERG